jgi:hypothetical protein
MLNNSFSSVRNAAAKSKRQKIYDIVQGPSQKLKKENQQSHRLNNTCVHSSASSGGILSIKIDSSGLLNSTKESRGYVPRLSPHYSL